MKPTPGPWRVITRERSSKPDRFGRTTETHETFINGADGLGSIAKLYIGHDNDARLIAAAPDLFDIACELLRLHAYPNEEESNQLADRARALLERMKP